jgi:hypothetical protein
MARETESSGQARTDDRRSGLIRLVLRRQVAINLPERRVRQRYGRGETAHGWLADCVIAPTYSVATLLLGITMVLTGQFCETVALIERARRASCPDRSF